ncbi:hypothetical protein [Flavobacterium sp. 3HN19-14]|uniref:hypothetical protein n=1 Tax=Flavobacterium sp. 3HN19-14 TaxID=3448133 RepID=UPI003EE1F7EF
MLKKTLTFLLMLICSAFAAAQKDDRKEMEGLFSKTQKVYENANSFKLATSYKLYPTYRSNTVCESYAGILFRNKEDFYCKIDKTEFIKIADTYIKVDNESKRMQLSNEKAPDPIEAYNIRALMSHFRDFSMTSTPDQFICTMTCPELTLVPYGKAIIYINKKDLTIDRQVMYMLNLNAYKNSKGKNVTDYPRLEILFSEFDSQAAIPAVKFKLETYIRKSKQVPIPAKEYKNYQIVD